MPTYEDVRDLVESLDCGTVPCYTCGTSMPIRKWTVCPRCLRMVCNECWFGRGHTIQGGCRPCEETSPCPSP